MRRIAAVLALGLIAVAGPLPAHAAEASYVGGCRLVASNRATGPNTWDGVVTFDVVPTDGFWFMASCELTIDNEIVAQWWGGGMFVADVAQVQISTPNGVTVSLCEHVTTTSGTTDRCRSAEVTHVVPPALGPVRALVEAQVCALVDSLCTVAGADGTLLVA